MSNAKVNVAMNSLMSNAKSTHYAVSTLAAVVYALVWILTNAAHAEPSLAKTEYATLPAVVVTGHQPAELAAVIVVGVRDRGMEIAQLAPVVVVGNRAELEQRVAANTSREGASSARNTNSSRVGYFARVRNWIKTSIGKVKG